MIINCTGEEKIEVFEMMCLRNAIIREGCRCELSVLERIERNLLKWFGHVERMGEEKLVKREHRANVAGNRGRERPQRRWRDEVKDLLFAIGERADVS